MWIDNFTFQNELYSWDVFSSHTNTHTYIIDIERDNLLPPMQVIQILAQSKTATLGLIKVRFLQTVVQVFLLCCFIIMATIVWFFVGLIVGIHYKKFGKGTTSNRKRSTTHSSVQRRNRKKQKRNRRTQNWVWISYFLSSSLKHNDFDC